MKYSGLQKGLLASVKSFDDFLISIEGLHPFDDIFIVEGEPVLVKVEGDLERVGEEVVTEFEMNQLTNIIYGGNNGVTEIGRGSDSDSSYEVVSPQTGLSYRYRVNVVGIRGKNNSNKIRIVMRSIKGIPRKLSDLNIEPEIIENLYPSQGIILVCGETGSGKSTLLSAIIRGILEDKNEHSIICEYSAPVETTYHLIERANSVIFQSEVGRDVPSFAAGIRNALRSNPDIILLGEMRDEETIRAGIGVSLMGQRVYSTTHSSTVGETLSRLILAYPSSEQKSKLMDIVGSIRGIIVQQLLKKKGGGRISARSWLFFDASIREKIMGSDLDKILLIMGQLTEEHGRTMAKSLRLLLEADIITEEIYCKAVQGDE